MNIEAFRYFVEVARSGSISQASRRLYVSQQGLSKALKALEEKLGVTLLVRTNRGIRPTDEGARILERAERLVCDYDALIREAHGLRVGSDCFDGAGIRLTTSLISLITIIHSLRKEGALSELVLSQAETARALERADDVDSLVLVDLPSCLYPWDEVVAAYDVTLVVETRFCVGARKELLPAGEGPLALEEVARLPLGVVDTETTRDVFARIFCDAPLANIRTLSTNEEELSQGVQVGGHAALTVGLQWEKFLSSCDNPSDFAMRELDCDGVDRLAFVRKKGLPLSAQQAAFVAAILKAYGSSRMTSMVGASSTPSNVRVLPDV